MVVEDCIDQLEKTFQINIIFPKVFIFQISDVWQPNAKKRTTNPQKIQSLNVKIATGRQKTKKNFVNLQNYNYDCFQINTTLI